MKLTGKHLEGVHFQDYSKDGKAHRAMGDGIVDFDPIFQYLKPRTPCILELAPSVTREGILSSKEYLESKLESKADG